MLRPDSVLRGRLARHQVNTPARCACPYVLRHQENLKRRAGRIEERAKRDDVWAGVVSLRRVPRSTALPSLSSFLFPVSSVRAGCRCLAT